jgi:hypothetical protein
MQEILADVQISSLTFVLSACINYILTLKLCSQQPNLKVTALSANVKSLLVHTRKSYPNGNLVENNRSHRRRIMNMLDLCPYLIILLKCPLMKWIMTINKHLYV